MRYLDCIPFIRRVVVSCLALAAHYAAPASKHYSRRGFAPGVRSNSSLISFSGVGRLLPQLLMKEALFVLDDGNFEAGSAGNEQILIQTSHG
jgi:hypothetical protein